MRALIALFLTFAFVCCAVSPCAAVKNANGKWALHYAGVHDADANTCGFAMTGCSDIVVLAPEDEGEYDIYVLAVDVVELTSTRYGLCCAGPFDCLGWVSCSDSETPSAGWPGCNEGNTQSWATEVLGPYVTLGILHIYHYGGLAVLKACEDPRVEYAEFCDGSPTSPVCYQTTDNTRFGCIGFSCAGYNPCGEVPVVHDTWGKIKSVYR